MLESVVTNLEPINDVLAKQTALLALMAQAKTLGAHSCSITFQDTRVELIFSTPPEHDLMNGPLHGLS